MEQLEDLRVTDQVKHLQEEVYAMQIWSNKQSQNEEELRENLTSLFHAITKYDESTASVTKDFSLKIATVKTDIRRISGLKTDVTLLVEKLHTLEGKIDKVEKTTVQQIGDLLANSIDRTAKLQSSASELTKQTQHITMKLSELDVDINKHSNKLLDLESDRSKVLKTVAFANDVRIKVYSLKKDFAHLEPMIDELTLRIGRLVGDLLERQQEIAFLNKKLSNLTLVQTEIKALSDKVSKISDLTK